MLVTKVASELEVLTLMLPCDGEMVIGTNPSPNEAGLPGISRIFIRKFKEFLGGSQSNIS